MFKENWRNIARMDVVQQNKNSNVRLCRIAKKRSFLCYTSFGKLSQADVLSTQLCLEGALILVYVLLVTNPDCNIHAPYVMK